MMPKMETYKQLAASLLFIFFSLWSSCGVLAADDDPLCPNCPPILRKNCTRIRTPTNSKISIYSDAPISESAPAVYADGKVVAYVCDAGFSLAGCGAIRCTNGTWYCANPAVDCDAQPRSEQCQIPKCIGCRAPLAPSNGGYILKFGNLTVTNQNLSYFPVNSTISYYCTSSFSMKMRSPSRVYLTSLESKCNPDQRWTNSPSDSILLPAESPVECVGCNFTKQFACLDCKPSTPGANLDENVISYPVGAKMECRCTNGLIGNTTAACREDLTWSESQPFCIGCNVPIVQPNCFIANSTKQPCVDNPYQYPIGAVVVFSPSPGFDIVGGKRTSTCLDSLQWSDPCPQCVGCPRPIVSDNCAFSMWRVNADNYAPGETVCYFSKTGYSLVGETCITCLTNGLWSARPPVCVGCTPPPPAPANGRICPYFATRKVFGVNETIEFCCDEGYSLVRCPKATCRGDLAWSCNNPRCVMCDEPPVIQNSYVLPPYGTSGPVAGKRPINESVEYFCFDSYTLRGCKKMVCTEDNGWIPKYSTESPCPPECVACPAPKLTTGECNMVDYTSADTPAIENNSTEMYPIGAKLNFFCKQNYRLLPGQSTTATCLDTLKWSSSVPQCGGCKTPSIPKNCLLTIPGHLPPNECADTYGVGDCIIFRPDINYSLLGNGTICCTANFTWSPAQLPTCVGCTPMPEFQNGKCIAPRSQQLTSYPIDSKLVCSCDWGYNLTGCTSNTVTCTSNLTWSCNNPQCAACSPPLNASLPVLYLPAMKKYPIGSVITFNCTEGYTLNGTSRAVCLMDGTWSQPAPSCLACRAPDPCSCDTCPLLKINYSKSPAPNTNNMFPVGTVAYYQCVNSLLLNGSTDATCLPTFKWSNPLPSCVGCKLVNYAPQNGFVYAVAYPPVTYSVDARTCPARNMSDYETTGLVRMPTVFGVGARVIFGCNTGYAIDHSPVIECQRNLTWTGIPPSCIDRPY